MIKLVFRTMLLTAMLMAVTVIANATSVTYSTQGCFGLGCIPGAVDSTSVGILGGSLNFIGNPSNTIDLSTGFSAAGLGGFFWSGTPIGNLGPVAFTLQITQTVPAGVGSFSALVSGFVTSGLSGGNSQVNVLFTTTAVNINGIDYQLTNLGGPGTIGPQALLINPPGQTTSIQSIATAVPEPTSMILLGTGLVGLAGYARRKFRKS